MFALIFLEGVWGFITVFQSSVSCLCRTYSPIPWNAGSPGLMPAAPVVEPMPLAAPVPLTREAVEKESLVELLTGDAEPILSMPQAEDFGL